MKYSNCLSILSNLLLLWRSRLLPSIRARQLEFFLSPAKCSSRLINKSERKSLSRGRGERKSRVKVSEPSIEVPNYKKNQDSATETHQLFANSLPGKKKSKHKLQSICFLTSLKVHFWSSKYREILFGCLLAVLWKTWGTVRFCFW